MANILMISPTPSHPQDAGNRSRIFRIAEHIRALNDNLYFAYYPIEGGDLEGMKAFWREKLIILPCENQKRTSEFPDDNFPKMGLNGLHVRPKSIDEWYDSGIEDPILQLHTSMRFDIIWVEYAYLSKVLEHFDGRVIKVIDTHDVFSDRDKMLTAHGIRSLWFYTTRQFERQGLSRADIVIAIREGDAAFFRRLGISNVITLGHFFPPQHRAGSVRKENSLLYVASDNPINVASWQNFLETTLTLIRKRIPHVSIKVAGKICKAIPDSVGYEKVGVVDNLGPLYQSAMIAICPVDCGTGLKIKCIEPLAFGCPVVTTPAGIEGIEEAEGHGILVGSTPEEFTAQLELLFHDALFYEKQRRCAFQFVKAYYRNNSRNLATILARVKNPDFKEMPRDEFPIF